MPNIVITEGLETPWELANTESNITDTTDLTSINLANQTVGTLAYAASQLFGSLKTEKNNLDNIVDAIELINEEIALFPGRTENWNTSQPLGLPDSVVGKIEIPVPRRTIATANSVFDTNLMTSNPINFLGTPTSGLSEERDYINALSQLIAVEPLLDSAGIGRAKGYAFISQNLFSSATPNLATWTTGPAVLEADPNKPINPGEMFVYRSASGQPLYYRLYYLDSLNQLDYYRLEPQQVIQFSVPASIQELESWRSTINDLDLLSKTKTISSTTGLPEGVTPPVTTLGLNTEKFSEKARYTTVAGSLDANNVLTSLGGPTDTYFSTYPPASLPDTDLSKLSKSDIGKFFKEPGTDRIIYVVGENFVGNLAFRIVTKTEPFITKLTDDIKKTLRGEYAEKQILLTQRSTDQTLFVTSITQSYTTFSDMATNLLKTLVNIYTDLARNLRS